MPGDLTGLRIHVNGIVQGVGFRPFVYSLAVARGLTGWVRNTSNGVEIELSGPTAQIEDFTRALRADLPPLARIDAYDAESCLPGTYSRFEILQSHAIPGQVLPVSPDVTICPDCRRELFDPHDRRYRYPFINCTNCGPRFTIIRDLPYDRPATTMASFQLCPACQAEYENPLDRRFHAQPVACPTCGPQLSFVSGGQTIARREEALQTARQWLAEGKIIAVKGLGGYLLACDATNADAVRQLRTRKKRSAKPFALMAFDLASIEAYASVSPAERDLLLAYPAPIVLLDRKSGAGLPVELAPGQNTLGFMLPYTPLHLLLLEPAPGFPTVLVMTSGNLSEEPIAYQDSEAFQRLTGIADGYLTHDRPVHMRIDDSVTRVLAGSPRLVRRARGYAPDALNMPVPAAPVLATGAELKNTFCLARDRYAFLSHHIGDLENFETFSSFEEGVQHYEKLFRIQPASLVCDLHPDYLASRYAAQRSAAEQLPLLRVQHHHAHLAACLAENGRATDEAVIGLCYDGTGLGTDQAIWGGEVLVGAYTRYQRVYHLAYTPLPGGDVAARKPARMALAHLWQAGLDWEPELAPFQALCAEERTVLRTQLQRKINTPLTSSMGRLFDAASALLGICQAATYEGQAAIEMEALCAGGESGSYPFAIAADTFDPAPLWAAMLADWRAGVPTANIAARFHNAVCELNLALCTRLRAERGIDTVALSGGVWQNRYLFEKTVDLLTQNGFNVLCHRVVPTNDGGLAFGQAAIAAFVTAAGV